MRGGQGGGGESNYHNVNVYLSLSLSLVLLFYCPALVRLCHRSWLLVCVEKFYTNQEDFGSRQRTALVGDFLRPKSLRCSWIGGGRKRKKGGNDRCVGGDARQVAKAKELGESGGTIDTMDTHEVVLSSSTQYYLRPPGSLSREDDAQDACASPADACCEETKKHGSSWVCMEQHQVRSCSLSPTALRATVYPHALRRQHHSWYNHT